VCRSVSAFAEQLIKLCETVALLGKQLARKAKQTLSSHGGIPSIALLQRWERKIILAAAC